MKTKNYIDEEKLRFNFLLEDLRRKKSETSFRFLLQATTTAMMSFVLFFSIMSLFFRDRVRSIFIPYFSVNSSSEMESASRLESQLTELKLTMSALQSELESLKDQPIEDKEIVFVKAELANLTTNIENLNETILEKPDTAITAKLLREKQISIDQKIDTLVKNQQRLEDQVDSFLSNLIAVPLFAGIAGLVFTGITAMVAPVITKIKDLFSNRKKSSSDSDL